VTIAVMSAARRRHEAVLAFAVLIGLTAMVPTVQWLDAHRPVFQPAKDAAPVLTPAHARRLSLGFNGLLADWYWLHALQYIGRKIQEQAPNQQASAQPQLDRIHAVDPAVLARMFELITHLDPRFIAAYEFAAVVLPAVDPDAAIAVVEQGVLANPTQWYLHQQLAYIHWQRGDYERAAEAFRRGARLANKPWMATMATKMEERGGDRAVAQQMYGRMYEETKEEQVKEWAAGRLTELRDSEERDTLARLLSTWYTRTGRCPWGWTEVADDVRKAGFRTDARGAPLARAGTPYIMVIGLEDCEVREP
jgi:tetratricopeptide (TPR) repeat protein